MQMAATTPAFGPPIGIKKERKGSSDKSTGGGERDMRAAVVQSMCDSARTRPGAAVANGAAYSPSSDLSGPRRCRTHADGLAEEYAEYVDYILVHGVPPPYGEVYPYMPLAAVRKERGGEHGHGGLSGTVHNPRDGCVSIMSRHMAKSVTNLETLHSQ